MLIDKDPGSYSSKPSTMYAGVSTEELIEAADEEGMINPTDNGKTTRVWADPNFREALKHSYDAVIKIELPDDDEHFSEAQGTGEHGFSAEEYPESYVQAAYPVGSTPDFSRTPYDRKETEIETLQDLKEVSDQLLTPETGEKAGS